MIIQKDILKITTGIICHACNSQNKFGKGLAKSIAIKFPKVRNEFLEFGEQVKLPKSRLGKVQLVKINEKLFVANLFTQLYYGDSIKTKIDYNDYSAWETCLDELNRVKGDRQIYFPKGVGCGLAGGDWNFVKKMIEDKIPEVIFCEI